MMRVAYVPARLAALGLLWCLCAVQALAATAGDPVGTVLIAVGIVEATDASGATRRLARRDSVFEGDTLRTADNSRAQIAFFDDARLALRPGTELAIDEYRDGTDGRAESAAMRLTRGGFRTVTGRVGGVNRAAYRMSTPYAVIGIRGTDYGAALEEVDVGDTQLVLVVGVEDGGVTVSNPGGDIDLGDGADFDFAQVTGPNDPPQGLDEPPTDLGLEGDLEAPGDGDDADADGDTDGDSDGDMDGNAEAGDEEAPQVDEEGNLVSQIGGEDEGETLFEYGQRCL
jgi:hypothetical protein